MIKFNIPYHSINQKKSFNLLIENKHFASGGWFAKKTKSFLKEKYNFNNTYLTTSCTSAIQLCSMAIHFQKGDEVIIPSYTFPSTPTPFILQGCKIVFADCKPDYPNVGLNEIKKLTTKNTKAVMIVHYGGYNNEIEAISKYCKEHNIVLIEDAAQSINSYHNDIPLGSFGDFGVFSFHETKNINCGEGGMLVVNNKKYLTSIETLYQFGTNRNEFIEGKINSYEWVSLGLSFGLSELNCSFLYPQLLELEQITEHRQNLWKSYQKRLSLIKENIGIPSIEVSQSNCHNFFIVLKDVQIKQELTDYLKNNNIQAVSHYVPLHQSKFGSKNIKSNALINATLFGNNLLRLPLHQSLTINDVEYISSKIIDFFE